MAPQVDLVIAVHSAARPIERAVRSVLGHTDAPVRVTVVVHEIDPGLIAQRLGDAARDDRLRLLPHSDGLRSPAGPFNAGLDAADAPYVAVMGSDDTLEPGALDSWLSVAESSRADVVIARLRHASGAAVPTPPVRPRHVRGLDGIRDRLSYRSAPLGLISRSRFPDLRFTVGVPTGEDIAFVTRLWFSGASIAYDRRGPAYLIHDDADQRATLESRAIAAEFRWLDELLTEGLLGTLSDAARHAVVVKFLRIHLFGAILHRPDPATWTAAERASLATIAQTLVGAGDGIHEVLSRLDRNVLDAALDPAVPAERLIEAALNRRNFRSPGALLPRNPMRALNREAPLRMATASALQLR